MLSAVIVGLGLAGMAIALSGLLLLGGLAWASSRTRLADDDATVVAYEVENPARTVSKDEAILTIVSYNLGYLSGMTNNLPVRRDLQLFEANLATAIATLSPLQPDILALQEVDLQAHRSFRQNQAEALAQGLGLESGAIAINWDKRYVPFPYWPPSMHFRQIVSAQVVLTNGSITDHRRIVLQQVAGKSWIYKALYLDRLAQVATLELEGRSLVVINVHLEAFDEPTRRRQTETVRALAESYDKETPLIMLGDFNSDVPTAEAADPTIQTLLAASSLRPAFAPTMAAAALSDDDRTAIATFPADAPTAKLDYIFYTPAHLEVVSCRVVHEAQQASDHLPIIVEFRWRSPT